MQSPPRYFPAQPQAQPYQAPRQLASSIRSPNPFQQYPQPYPPYVSAYSPLRINLQHPNFPPANYGYQNQPALQGFGFPPQPLQHLSPRPIHNQYQPSIQPYGQQSQVQQSLRNPNNPQAFQSPKGNASDRESIITGQPKKTTSELIKGNARGQKRPSAQKQVNGNEDTQAQANKPKKIEATEGGFEDNKPSGADWNDLGSTLKKKKEIDMSKHDGSIGDNISHTTNSTKPSRSYDVIKQQLQGNAVFKDPDFEPVPYSISSNPGAFKNANQAKWKRPQEFVEKGKPTQIFDSKILPDDIKQGGLGDCYFLSSLSALSETPGLIEKLFVTKSYQENGLHCVWLCHDGEFVQVVMDDYFPCSEKGGPIFSKSDGHELWTLFLEKAYSKIYGTYDKIESGLAGHALRDLTGAPYEYFSRDQSDQAADIDKCWNFIYENTQKNYILAASSQKNNKGMEVENNLGIVSSHCYAILHAAEVVGSDKQKDRIVQMRNPWGQKEWTGDWSDNSGKWTPQLKQQLDVESKDDGIFWISVKDFWKEFSQVCVCKVNPNYQYHAIKLSDIPNSEKVTRRVIMMRVQNKGHNYISLCQKDKRAFAKDPNSKYDYSLSRIIIGKIDSTKNEITSFVGDTLESDRDGCVEGDFDIGDYAIYCEVEWSQPDVRHLVLSSYGQSTTQFVEANLEDSIIDKELDGLLIVHNQFSTSDKAQDYGDGIKRTTGVVGGYIYFLYQNRSKGATLKETLKMPSRQNLVICPPQKNSDVFSVEVAPNTDVIVKYRVTPEDGGEYSYSTSCVHAVSKNQSKNDLKEQAKASPNKVTQRAIKGQPINVTINEYHFPGGIALLYMNQSGKKYTEQLKLQLKNLTVEDFPNPADIKIEIQNGGDFLLILRAIDPTQGSGFGSSMSFGLN